MEEIVNGSLAALLFGNFKVAARHYSDIKEAKSAIMNIFRKKNIFFSNHL